MEKIDSTVENSKLGWMTFITSIGDWLTYFALIKLAYESSGSVMVAMLSLTMKSLAIACGAWVLPWVSSHFGTKRLMVLAQAFSAIILLAVSSALFSGRNISVTLVYVFSFLLMALKQLFDASREVHSRHLSDESIEHRSLQAELLRGLFLAQLFGPILAFVLLKYFPIYVPTLIDGVSFLVTSSVALTLQRSYREDKKHSLLEPIHALKILRKKPELRWITGLRAIGFWIPNSFFNMILFPLALQTWSQGLEATAVFYTALGFGASFSSDSLKKGWFLHRKIKVKHHSDGNLAFVAQVIFGACTLLLMLPHNAYSVVALILLVGFVMGLNAVATQSIRRKLSAPSELSRVISVELILARVTEVLTIFGYAFLTTKLAWGTESILLVSGLLFCIVGALHTQFD